MTGVYLPANYNKGEISGYSYSPNFYDKIQTMTERDFIYWLKGFLEISDPKRITEEQLKVIKDHLDLLFNKITPERRGIWGYSGYSC